MKEQLITFETAKLAKEKGLNKNGLGGLFYNSKGKIKIWNNEYDNDEEQCICCTQSLLQKWLRDNHKIHCEMWYNYHREKWECSLYLLKSGEKLNDGLIIQEETFEQALEVGLKEALKKLKIKNTMNWKIINNDVNGNPRYVCHYLELLTDKEKESNFSINDYSLALKRAKTLGGKKYHNKSYGGGIVFQSYNIDELEKSIKTLLEI